MTTESATSLSLPWLWVIEALASFYQVDVITLRDVVSEAPELSDTVGKDAREVVAFRCLEVLTGLGNYMHKYLPSASGPKIGFDLSESCEVFLRCILAEDEGMTGSVESMWDIHSFVSQKRGTLPQIALEQLKNSIVEGTHPYAVNLREMSGLALSPQCSNITSADEVNRNEGRGIQNISRMSLLSSKRLTDDSAPDCTMQNDDAHLSKRQKSKQVVNFLYTNDKMPPSDGTGCQGRKELLPNCLERDLSPGVVDDVHDSPDRVEQRSDVRVDVPSTAANICDLSRDSQAFSLEDVVHADENAGVGYEIKKELLPVFLERDLPPGVHDVHVSPNRVEQWSDVQVDVPSTAANVRDLSRDSQAAGLEDMVWQHAGENDGMGCQSRKESLHVCLERDLSPGVVDDVHVSPNRVEQRTDVRVDVPSTAAIICDFSVDLNMLADKVASGNECSVEPHGPPLSASALKGKEKEISDDYLENDGDGSIPLEGADLFIQFEEPDDFFLHKEPGICIPLEEPDVHTASVEPAIHSSCVPHKETNAKPDGCLLLEKPDLCIPLPELVHIPLIVPEVLIPCRKTDDDCTPVQQPEADSIPCELPKFGVALAERQVAATGGLEKDTDIKDIENDLESNSPTENSRDHDPEDIDVAATKGDFLSSQCNLTEDSLSTAEWTEFNFCMKCKMDGQLLRCSSPLCPVVVHEVCLFFPASLDKEGNFYCPFCAYSHAASVYLEAKKKAFERKKLTAFIGGRQGDSNLLVDTHCNGNFREKAVSQANCGEEHPNCGEEHPSRVRNYSCREQEDDKQLKEEPPISGASKNVSHITGTSISGEACGAEYSRVHVPKPMEMVQGHGNQFVAADFVGHETSKVEKGKSAKSRYSTRVQKEKKKYTCPVVPGLRRKTIPWTTEEVNMLMEGLKKFNGTEDEYIPWKEILTNGGTVLKGRTAVDLKDKWRNICRSSAFNKSSTYAK